jgi:Fe2+ or Zn2+ uptake regulation protein
MATTMDEKYGDGSNHLVCEKCGMCIDCGDCEEYGCGKELTETS